MGLFGSKPKPDYSKLYPDPPQYNLAPGSLNQYQGQIQSLVDLFGSRSRGEDQFDYMKFLYGPQEAEVNRQYGINQQPGDQYQGSLQRTNASLNQRGLLDSGTSGVIQAQLEADRNRQLAELFGQSKMLQRQDIDQSLSNLGELYPTQFQTAQIQPNIDYQNAMSRFNQDFNRNSAQQSYEASKPGSPWPQLIGTAVGSLFGPAGASVGGSIGQQFSGGGWAQQPQSGGLSSMFGGLGSMFGGGGNQPVTPYPSLTNSPGFSNYGMPSGRQAYGGYF